ncbi:MAG: glycoside hydrolase, partial [Terracidiphilus sp.]
MKVFVVATVLAASSLALAQQAQRMERPIPSLVQKDGRYALIVDGAPFLMLGAQSNNSSDWPGTLNKVWPAI